MSSVTGALSTRTLNRLIALTIGSILVITTAIAFYLGRMSAPSPAGGGLALQHLDEMRALVARERQRLSDVRDLVDTERLATARRLGNMQAHIQRLNAAGAHLARTAELDPEAFNFSLEPGLGGDYDPVHSIAPPVDVALRIVDDQLEMKSREMDILEHLILPRELQDQVIPSGWPVEKGYISSGFGTRSDPFTGRKTRHSGIDFAARSGTYVLAVASGEVQFAGRRAAFGNLLEINHGNGYVTRYGHNKANLVRVGEPVVKGQPIALVGSTGRSTGSHVHFEVLVDGQRIDPVTYISSEDS